MSDDKKFPAASEGMKELFNMQSDESTSDLDALSNDSGTENSLSNSSTDPSTSKPPMDLPIGDFDNSQLDSQLAEQAQVAEEVIQDLQAPDEVENLNDILKTQASVKQTTNESSLVEANFIQKIIGTKAWSLVKNFAPYVLIFAIGIGLYNFYFSDFSINSLLNNDSLKIESLVSSDQQNSDIMQLKEDSRDDYLEWIAQFFRDVNDETIIDMDTDVSGNGLTNFEKYLLNLNPKVYSTRGNIGDGQAVIEGINPWTGEKFTDKQKDLVEKYINKELISNRITAAALTRGVTKFAQYVNPDSPYYIDPEKLSELKLADTIIAAPGDTAPSDTVSGIYGGLKSASAVSLNPSEAIDQTKAGRLDIPSYGISVPLVWTQDVKNFDSDLRKGIVHYPGTALPGEVGTSYISGHSSGYLWDKNPYKTIFEKLGTVKDGTSFTITATQRNGAQVKFNYVVERRGEFAADDQAQFISTAESVVALSTCWPVGTTDRRLVLFSKLTQIERS
ncbi:MAG: sortase [Candidatus Doudnabacteria bacterium]